MQVTKTNQFRFVILAALLTALSASATSSMAVAQTEEGSNPSRFPAVEIAHRFGPPGESNVRSSIRIDNNIALIGTEETGDVFKTTDGGKTWTKTIDGNDLWKIQDVRNFHRGSDGKLYATTSEPALVISSEDEGKIWKVLARPAASRTVALTQTDTGRSLESVLLFKTTDLFPSFRARSNRLGDNAFSNFIQRLARISVGFRGGIQKLFGLGLGEVDLPPVSGTH